jgi:hypothetical protein
MAMWFRSTLGLVMVREFLRSMITDQRTRGVTLEEDPNRIFPAIRLGDFDFSEQCLDLLKIDLAGLECRTVRGAANFYEIFDARGSRESRSYWRANFLYEFKGLVNQRRSVKLFSLSHGSGQISGNRRGADLSDEKRESDFRLEASNCSFIAGKDLQHFRITS